VTEDWLERPEGGSALAMRLLMSIALTCGRSVSRMILLPITAYFLLRRAPERRASRDYLQRILGRPPTWLEVARHFHVFATVTLDRVFLLREKLQSFDLRLVGLEELHTAMNFGRGVLMIGAHVGSFDALRAASLKRPDVHIRVVLDAEHSPALSRIVRQLNPAIAANIINPRQDGTAVVLEIGASLQQGAIVTMLGDRARPGNPTATVDFLGSPAQFPTSPWLIAAASHAPVVLCLGLYRGRGRYDLHFELLERDLRVERSRRQEQLHVIVERFATRVAAHLRTAPYNWFNFYDFWNDTARDEVGRPAAGASTTGPGRR
jgi:predicted LPLAT superfamily acyltransferase